MDKTYSGRPNVYGWCAIDKCWIPDNYKRWRGGIGGGRLVGVGRWVKWIE